MTNLTDDLDNVEAMARAIWRAMLKTGLANDVRDWDEKSGAEGAWRTVIPALDDETKEKVLVVAEAAITRLRAENERLRNAAKALYFAGVWHCDREVDEAALWIEMRDALRLEEGSATKAGVAGK